MHKMLKRSAAVPFMGKAIRRAIRVCQDFFYEYVLNEKHHPSSKNVLYLKR